MSRLDTHPTRPVASASGSASELRQSQTPFVSVKWFRLDGSAVKASADPRLVVSHECEAEN